jgi:hypothetical protein
MIAEAEQTSNLGKEDGRNAQPAAGACSNAMASATGELKISQTK